MLAVDPGFKSGCKLAALDQFGNVLGHDVIYLIGSKPGRKEEAKQKSIELIRKHELTVVAIGNGTACRETEDFFAEMLGTELKDQGVAYVIVNEAGASVYSTSQLGREEFPSTMPRSAAPFPSDGGYWIRSANWSRSSRPTSAWGCISTTSRPSTWRPRWTKSSSRA